MRAANRPVVATTSSLLALLFLTVTVVGSGCADSTLKPANGKVADPTPTNNGTVADDQIPDNPPPPDGCCIMIPAGGETHLDVPAFNQLDVGILLFSRETGAPVPNESIEFELLDGTGGAALTERNRVTDTNGLARIGFVAGQEFREYVVRAKSPEANSVEFFINVIDQPSGDLHVTYLNAGESVYAIGPIETRVYPGNTYSCNDFRPLSQLPPPTFQDEVRSASGESDFVGLSVDGTWTVVAMGRGEFGQLAAVGCEGDVYMRENQVTNIEVVLTLLPLNPVGRYRNVSNWDFSQALQETGNVGSIILTVFNAFENPGQFLVDQVIEIVRTFLGGIIAGAVDFFLGVFGLDDEIANAINGFIAGNDFLRRLQQAGLDLRDMVTNLEVISTLTIGKIGADYEVYGTDDWLGLAVYWRWNCDENSPPDCGRTEIAIDPDSSLNLVYGEWTGRVAAYNELQIYPHTVNLHYGRLIVYLLTEFIIPTLTDGAAHSLVDAILYWINCDGMAAGITGSDGEICAPLDIVCVSADQISGVCDSVLRTVFGFGEVLLGNLEVESVLEMSGTAKLIEMDGDQLVDEIVDGHYDGTVNIQGTRSPFSSDFNATRIPREDVDGQ